MEFVPEPKNGHAYFVQKSCLSQDGKYFWIFDEFRNGPSYYHSVLVRDLDNNPNGDIWISTEEMIGSCTRTKFFIAGNKAVISCADGDDNDAQITPFAFGLDDGTKTFLSCGNGYSSGGIACHCVSPDSRVLAITWENCDAIEFYCTRTWSHNDSCFEAMKVDGDITGLFFASSTGDTLGTVWEKHAFMYNCGDDAFRRNEGGDDG